MLLRTDDFEGQIILDDKDINNYDLRSYRSYFYCYKNELKSSSKSLKNI